MVAVLPALVAMVLLTGCGDGRPAFCDRLEEQRSLDALSKAIERGDPTAAAAEADGLTETASAAPREIRPQMEALAEAVVDLVELLEAESSPQTEGSGDAGSNGAPATTAEGSAGTDLDDESSNDATSADGTGSAEETGDGRGGADPGDVERLRKELDDRLGGLSDDSSAVSSWAEENCGFTLS